MLLVRAELYNTVHREYFSYINIYPTLIQRGKYIFDKDISLEGWKGEEKKVSR